LLCRVLASPGQTFLATVAKVLAKPPTQDVVQSAFEVLSGYFAPLRPAGDPDLDALLSDAAAYAEPDQGHADARACLAAAPDLGPEIRAMRLLSGLGYGALRPVLRDTTAIGSLMRRKIEPVVQPVVEAIATLTGKTPRGG
jgi:hypothetical protein